MVDTDKVRIQILAYTPEDGHTVRRVDTGDVGKVTENAEGNLIFQWQGAEGIPAWSETLPYAQVWLSPTDA